jgi:hypothetical protein
VKPEVAVVREQGRYPVGEWLLEGLAAHSTQHHGPHTQPSVEHRRRRWWKVMCLPGVDSARVAFHGDRLVYRHR